jgi:hypothetical protein
MHAYHGVGVDSGFTGTGHGTRRCTSPAHGGCGRCSLGVVVCVWARRCRPRCTSRWMHYKAQSAHRPSQNDLASSAASTLTSPRLCLHARRRQQQDRTALRCTTSTHLRQGTPRHCLRSATICLRSRTRDAPDLTFHRPRAARQRLTAMGLPAARTVRARQTFFCGSPSAC